MQKAGTRWDEEVYQSRIVPTDQEERSENNLTQIRPTPDGQKWLHKTRGEELRDNEIIVEELLKTLDEEQQVTIRAVEELSQARVAYTELEDRLQKELAQTRRALDDKERTENELQRTLEEEQRARTDLDEELSQSRIICTELEERLENERLSNQSRQEHLDNLITEQRRHLEEERQQKAALEERLSSAELQMQEERRRHLSTERELQEALAECQGRQSRDWIIEREEIDLSQTILGKGAWGNVRKGTFRACQVAVKEIHELILSVHNRRLFEREMSIASRCRHPNLLQFIGATNDDDSPLFVTELLDTSLRHLLSQRALNHNEEIVLALDVAKGLNYLHCNKPPIIHRDISSANVLLWRGDETWRAKLSDYGAANFMRQYMTANPGAIIYSAPEAFTNQQSPKVKLIFSLASNRI